MTGCTGFRCTKCDKKLELSSYAEDSATGRLYCKPHYQQLAAAAGGISATAGNKGIDSNVGKLISKRKKVELEDDVERISAGSTVWVEGQADGVGIVNGGINPRAPEPFVLAEVASVDGDIVSIRPRAGSAAAKKDILIVPLRAVALADLGDPRLNNLQLLHLNEPNLLYNVRARFIDQHVYTNTGSLELLAVNPYEHLDELYSQETMEWHARSDGETPHTFAVAERIYRALMQDDESPAQSVVVSGESGAGKTETNKHLVAYLRWRSGTPLHGTSSVGHERTESMLGLDTISQAISLSNIVLEALGNAKTTHNSNSSRFGKYLEMLFAADGSIVGATFRTFLLEKSRVAHQAPGERNFHVFYQLLASHAEGGSAVAQHLGGLGLASASEHAITATHTEPGSGHDADNFVALLAALQDAAASPVPLVGALAAVIHLGDVGFEGDEKGCGCSAAGERALQAASSQLGVEAAALREQLTQRIISTGNDDVTIPLSPDGASLARDACCKALYQRLFSFYVHCLNVLLRPKLGAGSPLNADQSRGRSVGVLDVFGFESLATNSFEQLCINLANEKLHAQFLTHVFQGVPESLFLELMGSDTSGLDNTPCLAVLEAPPNGILHLLDHKCRSPNASESSFCLAVNQMHAESPFLTVPKLSRTCTINESGGFIVRHFAGDVLYTGGNFLELNNDTLHSARFFKSSSNAFVQHLFTSPGLQPPQPRAGASFASVGARFATDLNKLLRTLQATEVHFIRCMKPNLQQQPGLFDSAYVRSRLRAAGSLAALKFLKKVQGGGSLAFRTLERLRSKLEATGGLPPPLDAAKQTADFAHALLTGLDVPAGQFRVTSDAVALCTGLVPFLVRMETHGEEADLEAVSEVRRCLNEPQAMGDVERRRAERAAKVQSTEQLRSAVTEPAPPPTLGTAGGLAPVMEVGDAAAAAKLAELAVGTRPAEERAMPSDSRGAEASSSKAPAVMAADIADASEDASANAADTPDQVVPQAAEAAPPVADAPPAESPPAHTTATPKMFVRATNLIDELFTPTAQERDRSKTNPFTLGEERERSETNPFALEQRDRTETNPFALEQRERTASNRRQSNPFELDLGEEDPDSSVALADRSSGTLLHMAARPAPKAKLIFSLFMWHPSPYGSTPSSQSQAHSPTLAGGDGY